MQQHHVYGVHTVVVGDSLIIARFPLSVLMSELTRPVWPVRTARLIPLG